MQLSSLLLLLSSSHHIIIRLFTTYDKTKAVSMAEIDTQGTNINHEAGLSGEEEDDGTT